MKLKALFLTLVPHCKEDWKSIGFNFLPFLILGILSLIVVAIVFAAIWLGTHFLPTVVLHFIEVTWPWLLGGMWVFIIYFGIFHDSLLERYHSIVDDMEEG